MDIKLVNIGFGNIVAANRYFYYQSGIQHRLNSIIQEPVTRLAG